MEGRDGTLDKWQHKSTIVGLNIPQITVPPTGLNGVKFPHSNDTVISQGENQYTNADIVPPTHTLHPGRKSLAVILNALLWWRLARRGTPLIY